MLGSAALRRGSDHDGRFDRKHAGRRICPKAPIGPCPGVVAEWTVTILLLLFGTTTLVQAFVIPTGSMEESLLIGDHLLVDKLTYAPPGAISRYLLPYQEVERGDIVVFRYPIDLNQTFVKRVVGVPETACAWSTSSSGSTGVRRRSPTRSSRAITSTTTGDNFPVAPHFHAGLRASGAMLREHVVDGELVVPDGQYFAMGDNRDQSLDSRYWGFVPRNHIIGKPLIIYWSYDCPDRTSAGSRGSRWSTSRTSP